VSQVFKKGPISAAINMTPMIDVVFQLLIFFMLVNNISNEEGAPMIVPELEDPKTLEFGDRNRVVINIEPMAFPENRKIGDINIPGQASSLKIGIERYALDDMDGVTKSLQQAKARNDKVEVLLRADAGLFYDEVQPVMQAIANAGIVKVNLVAYLPEDVR
jgi:biopolymer transport protein ExbD